MRMNRRVILGAATAGGALLASGAASAAVRPRVARVVAEEHWVMKGDVKLYVYRKRVAGQASKKLPVLFLVHGSTFASRSSYDLQVPGRTGYSAMDHFARLGYDVWTMDHESYGFSQRTQSNSGIQNAFLRTIDTHASQSKVWTRRSATAAAACRCPP